MNDRPRVVIGYAVGWCIIVFFVVLLTVIFSFLGTFICAALAGMMMGGARFSRWHSLLASLVFPVVMAAVFGISRAALAETQVLLLALLSFGVFWATYAVTSPLGPKEAAAKRAASRPDATRKAPAAVDQATSTALAESEILQAVGELRLESLQGVWFAKAPVQEPSERRKVLEIHNQKVVLSVLDANGKVCSKAEGHLELGRNA